MWIARNKDGDLRIFSHKPTLSSTHLSYMIMNSDGGYITDAETQEQFKDLTFEDGPVEISIKSKKQNKYETI